MRLSVRGIQSQPGAKVRAEFREDGARLLDGTVETEGPIELHVVATNLGGSRVGLEGRLRARVRLTCSRCAQDYTMDVDEPVQEIFVRQAGPGDRQRLPREETVEWWASDEEAPFDEETEERPFWGDTLELDELVRELLLLAIPMKPICRDDCQGLCPVCGGDRNQVACSCQQDMTDPRLAALRRWMEAAGEAGPLSS